MTTLKDMLPPGTEAHWSCGHIGGAVCKQCHEELIQRANLLALRVSELEELIERMNGDRRSYRVGAGDGEAD